MNRPQRSRLWYAPVLTLAMGLMLARLLIMARLLDLDGFAAYGAGLLVSSSFCLLACGGLQLLLQRELPVMIVRRRERAGGVLCMQCNLVALACAAAGAGAAMIGDVSLAGLPPPILAMALIHGLSHQLFLVATIDSRSRGEPLRFANENLNRSLMLLPAASSLAALGGQAWAILGAEATVSFVLAGTVIKRNLRGVGLRPIAATVLAWRRLPVIRWHAVLALLGVNTMAFVTVNLDRWVAAQLLPTSSFASYAFAWTILMVAQSLQVVVNASLFPLLARHRASEESLLAYVTSVRASLALLALGAVMALPLWALLDYSAARWFASYQEARDLLPVFLVISVLRLSDYWSSYLLVVGREGRLLLLNSLSPIVAAIAWVLLAYPEINALRADQVALMALLLTIIGYVATALAAWHCSYELRKEAA